MGANTFDCTGTGKTAQQAFLNARDKAQWDHGHSGYTGTIAEKQSYVEIAVPDGKDPTQYATELMRDDDARVNDKWGPAGCVKLKDGEWLFFGWASS